MLVPLLFSLHNNSNAREQKLQVFHNHDNALCCASECGPCFRGGHHVRLGCCGDQSRNDYSLWHNVMAKHMRFHVSRVKEKGFIVSKLDVFAVSLVGWLVVSWRSLIKHLFFSFFRAMTLVCLSVCIWIAFYLGRRGNKGKDNPTMENGSRVKTRRRQHKKDN